MKKVLSIIIIALLFIISSLIFWVRFSPETFLFSFKKYPTVQKTFMDDMISDIPNEILIQSTSSESVLSHKGQIIIGNNVWDVEIAKNDADRVNGLSNRKILYKNTGMLFVFDKMGPLSFWMKDMLFSIDMIFLDSSWRIVLIESNLQPDTFPKTFGSSVESQYVLELNASEASGHDLKVGDQAIFLNK